MEKSLPIGYDHRLPHLRHSFFREKKRAPAGGREVRLNIILNETFLFLALFHIIQRNRHRVITGMNRQTVSILFFFWGALFFHSAAVWAADPLGSQTSLTARELVKNLRTKTFTGKIMDLDFDNVEVSQIFERFEEISGLDFEVDAIGKVARKLTFKGIEWDRGLHLVLLNLDLDLRLDGDTLHVVAARSRSAGASMFFPAFVFTIVLLVSLGVFLLHRQRKKAGGRSAEKKISIPEDRIEELTKRVLYLFEVEKIYRQELLSLNALAEKLGIPPHHLSWILNARIGKTFSDFLNHFRVEEVKQRLADSGERDLTILDIAFSAGFNSKSSFNKTFKASTGKTPSEFRSESIH